GPWGRPAGAGTKWPPRTAARCRPAPIRACAAPQVHAAQRKAPPCRAALFRFATAIGKLLDLGFLELDVLARDRIVLALGQLVGHRAAVLLGDVEEAGVGRRQKLDLDGRSLGHWKSVNVLE